MAAKGNLPGTGPRLKRGPVPWLLLAGGALLPLSIVQLSEPRIGKPADLPSAGTFPAAPAHPRHHWTDPLEDRLKEWLRNLEAGEDERVAAGLARLEAGAIPAALAFLQQAEPADLAADLSRRLLHRWAASHPRDVADWINRLPPGSERRIAVDHLALAWAASGPADAAVRARYLTDEAELHQVLAVAANEAVRDDPVQALQLAVELPEDESRDDLIRRAAMEWVARDAPGALEWARQIGDDTLREQVLACTAVAWAEQDPEAAANLAVAGLTEGRLQDDTLVSIVQRWAQQQPETVAAWVAGFPDGPLRTAAWRI